MKIYVHFEKFHFFAKKKINYNKNRFINNSDTELIVQRGENRQLTGAANKDCYKTSQLEKLRELMIR